MSFSFDYKTNFNCIPEQDAQLGIELVGHIGKDSNNNRSKQKALLNCPALLHLKYCKLPAHMHDKVSAVDGFSFWFSSRKSFQGTKSIVMQTSIVFRPNFRRRGAKVSEGAPPPPPCGRKPGFRQYYVIIL